MALRACADVRPIDPMEPCMQSDLVVQNVTSHVSPLKESAVIKRSVVVDGHKTSVSLEDAFWSGVKDIAARRGITLSTLIGTIDTHRRTNNLSSAVRLFVLEHFRARAMSAMFIGERVTAAPSIVPRISD
jgi:predicted DNA-binding ribbon-helix-helix protein